MARPRRNEIASKELHKAVTKLARKRNPTAKPKDIELWAYAERGVRVSEESIRKAHLGEIDPTQCAVELLLVLRGFYDAGPGELGDTAERRMLAVAAFHTPSTPSGQESDASGWLSGTTDRHLQLVG